MSTTALPALPVPTRTRWAQVPSVALAIAGRFGWRLWWPVATWLLAAALAWFSLRIQNSIGEAAWATLPSGIMLLGGLVAMAFLWLGGARFALSLGHDRAVVFGVTAKVSLALQAALHLVSVTAAWLEYRMLGEGGLHVFALETENKFGTFDTVWNYSWLFGLYYMAPAMLGILVLCVALARWGALGWLSLPVIVVGWALVTLLIGAPVLFLWLMAALAAAWALFRRVPV